MEKPGLVASVRQWARDLAKAVKDGLLGTSNEVKVSLLWYWMRAHLRAEMSGTIHQ